MASQPAFPCQPHLSSRKITPFSASVIHHGCDSSFARRRQETALFQRGGRRFAQGRRQALHRARRVLRSEGARGPRVAAFRDGPVDVLAGQGRAVEPDGGAPPQGLQGAGCRRCQVASSAVLRGGLATPTRWVVMGRVMAPWGVKGALKIEPFGSGSGNLCKYSAWWVGKPGKLNKIAVA